MISWVRVDAGIADDPKVGRIAGSLGCDEPKAIGHLVLLWAKMANHARDGNLASQSDDTLERWAGWRGRRGRFAATVRDELCTPQGVMRAWERHNGAPIRKAEADLARKQGRPDGRAGGRADSPRDTRAARRRGGREYGRTDGRTTEQQRSQLDEGSVSGGADAAPDGPLAPDLPELSPEELEALAQRKAEAKARFAGIGGSPS